MKKNFEKGGGEITNNGDNTKTYSIKINGERVSVIVYIDGPKKGQIKSATGGIIGKAINDACFDIQTKRGGSIPNVMQLLVDLKNFTSYNLGSWNKIYTGKDSLYTFMYHATVGGAIKQAMWNDDTYGGDTGQFNMMIGFWTSYYVRENEKNGWDIKWDSEFQYNVNGTVDAKKSNFGIVDIARLMRAVMWKENYSGVFDNTKVHNGDYGLMQINRDSFLNGFDSEDGHVLDKQGILYKSPLFKELSGYKNNESLWQTNIFGNIGAGIGILFNRTFSGSDPCYGSPIPTVWHWLTNEKDNGFIHGYNPDSVDDVLKVRDFWIKMTKNRYRLEKKAW